MSVTEDRPLLRDSPVRTFGGIKDCSVPMCGDRSLELPNSQTDGYLPDISTTMPKPGHPELDISDKIDSVILSWENVNVFVKAKRRKPWFGEKPPQKTKHILKNGLVKPGTLLAIMGASGSGKSTLLNVLTGRNMSQYILEGNISVNGVELGREIKDISAYCQQDEMFVGTLTVREHLFFRAMLRMDNRLSKKARLQRVEEVIVEMGLTKCADSRIGISGHVRGISGGEMRRLSFASELLTNPPLMFCDEPTSGLDSFMAQSVVQSLQNMANKGGTILCTIHQPSSEVFAMFNQVLLLAEGRVTFLGSTTEAFEFFKRRGYNCPANFNPSDFYVLTLAIVPGGETECQTRVQNLCDSFLKCSSSDRMKGDIKDVKLQDDEENSPLKGILQNNRMRYSTSWQQQFFLLLWRSWICLFRDVALFQARVGQTLFISVILGVVYLGQPYNQEGVMNINGALFLLLIYTSLTSMFAVINSFPIGVPIFLREYESGLYRADVYFLTKTLAELPTFIFLPWFMVAVIYWMIGFYNDIMAFLTLSGTIVLASNVAVSFGYLISISCGCVDIALAVGPAALVPLMMFAGYFLNNGSVPVYFVWLKYLSWFKFANEIISVNQWRNVNQLGCEVDNETLLTNGSNVSSTCYRNGEEVLASLNFSKDNVVLNTGLLAALLVGYRIIGFCILLIKARYSQS